MLCVRVLCRRSTDFMAKNLELMPTEVIPDYIPEALQNDGYYFINDECMQRAMEVKQEIIDLKSQLDPWIAKAAELRAKGQSFKTIGTALKRREQSVSKALATVLCQKLIHFYQHLDVLFDGPNEFQRKQMLWRVAVDNERMAPKEAIKAIAELNKMTAPSKGGAPNINIVISNNVLQKGPLDG